MRCSLVAVDAHGMKEGFSMYNKGLAFTFALALAAAPMAQAVVWAPEARAAPVA